MGRSKHEYTTRSKNMKVFQVCTFCLILYGVKCGLAWKLVLACAGSTRIQNKDYTLRWCGSESHGDGSHNVMARFSNKNWYKEK